MPLNNVHKKTSDKIVSVVIIKLGSTVSAECSQLSAVSSSNTIRISFL